VNVVLGGVAEGPADTQQDGLLSPAHRRTMGIALGGAGALGFVVGTVFGITAKSTYDHAWSNECSQDARMCSAQGVSDGKSAHDQATLSTVSFVAGALFLAGGAALYFTAPKAPSVAVASRMSPTGASLSVETVW
jgi:hypothetical protein